ncbi:MAG: cofactor-independent phosphoglycerate mutase [Candidatus Methanospirareceae archaeon]
MKYIVLIGDGMADYPIPERGNMTALQMADTPNMDFIASEGMMGVVKTIPDEMDAGSDVAILSILGYDPLRYYTGRGPLEAIGMNIPLREGEIAFRCNLITEKEGRIEDYSGGHISDEEAKELIEALNREIGTENIRFYAGISYRHLLVLDSYNFEGEKEIGCAPPHDIVGKCIADYLPRDGILRDIILSSRKVLAKYKRKANMVWIWSGGRKPATPKFEEIYHIKGSVISAVYLIKGVGRCAGLDVIEVPGATGYIDTNYEGKARYALNSLEEKDFVLVHVEAPDEASHIGDIDMKVRAIEEFDKRVVGIILDGLEERFREEGYRILVMPDHYTPVSLRKHTREAVPFAIYGYDEKRKKGEVKGEFGFDEASARVRGLGEIEASKLIPLLLGKTTEGRAIYSRL